MKLRHKINGGTVSVSDELGSKLLAGQWEEVKAEKPASSSRRKKTDAGSDDNDG